MTIPKLILMAFVLCLFAQAQTKITTETQTTVTTETQTKVAVVQVKQQATVQRRVALIVQNHASGADIPMMALTDALTASLSGCGLQAINPYNAVGINQNRSIVGEETPKTSALELSRELGAEGIVTASVIEFHDIRLGTPSVLHQYSIRITLNLADAGTGATVCGETVKIVSPKYTNNQVAQNRHEYLGDLMYSAAEKCAQILVEKSNAANWQPTPHPPKKMPQPKPLQTEPPFTGKTHAAAS